MASLLFRPKFQNENQKLPKAVIKDGAKWLMMPSKIIMDCLSVWPEHQNNTTKTLNLLCLLSYLLFFFGQIIYLTDSNMDVVSIASGMTIFFVGIDSAVRRILLYVCRERLTKILRELYFTFWPSDFVGTKLHKELLKESWYLYWYWFSYALCAVLCGFQYITVPYFNRDLILKTSFPFDWKKSPYYELLYVWQSFLCFDIIFCVCALDLLFASLLFNCVAQFKLLRTFLCKNFGKTVRLGTGGLNQRIMERKVLLDCVQYHKKLLWMCEEIDSIFSYLILVQFLTSMGTVCISSFLATVQPEELGTAFPYCIGHISEILFYCYVGNELINESTAFADAVFQCGWHLSATENDLQKSLVMVMLRSQKPVCITAGGFGILNLPTFLKLIKFSFSVYTVLNSVMGKKDE